MEARWSWLRARNGALESVQSVAPPSMETLERRLLLSADLTGSHQLKPLEVGPSEPVVVVDLTRSDDVPAATQSLVLPIDLSASDSAGDLNTSQPNPISIDLDQAQPGEQPATAALSSTSFEQLECAVTIAGPFGSPALLPDDSTDPAVSDQRSIVLDTEGQPIDIRGPPTIGLDSLIAANCDSVNHRLCR